MIDAEYCQTMAAYNGWMNRRVYEAAARLPDEARKSDRGAFFRSIHSTLNHILWGDRVWLPRFNGSSYPVGKIGSDLYDSFADLHEARSAMDDEIVAWAAQLDNGQLAGTLTWYSGVAQRELSRPRWLCVVQMFNHQTHHRGQVFPFGTIPAGGSEIPTFLSYATEKKLSKHTEEFGTTGAIEGVAGPEAANNAAITATLIPLLTLGIPTSNTTAILLGAFQNYGINPGPQLFDTNAALVWALIASLYIGNVMLLVLNLPLVGLWVKLLKIPKPPLYAGILIFATVGVYGMRQSAFDLVLLYAIGLLGVVMRRFDFPTAPVVVGMILGPLAEAQMRNALSIGEGKWGVFLERPMSLTLLVVIFLVLGLPRLLRLRRRLRRAP